MKLRNPQGEPPILPAGGKPLGYWEKSLDMSLITPIYGGGVKAGQPDKAMPIRASAIRGQLRFWWRLLNRHRFHDNRVLYQAETAIWGGLGSGELGAASRVVVRVVCSEKPVIKNCAKYEPNSRGNQSLIWLDGLKDSRSYALFPGQGKVDKVANKVEKYPAELIHPPLQFTLRVGIWPKHGETVEDCQPLWESDILPALRWWASFGGIGARTRRGLGSVKAVDLTPVTAAEVTAIGGKLKQRNANPNAEGAWKEAIEKLRKFRQGENLGRNPGMQPNRPGRSRWPEADSIRQITGHYAAGHAPAHPARLAFPRAVFGLPIVTHYNGNHEPADTTLSPLLRGEKQDRLSSPLILKAMWNGSDYNPYTPIALLLPHDHVSQMGLQLEGGGSVMLKRMDTPDVWWPATAQTAMTTGAQPNPLHGETGDVLADFLKFFGS